MKKYGWDTTVAVFRETDPAQHSFWKDMKDNESELDGVILRVYQEIDREVENPKFSGERLQGSYSIRSWLWI
jgi:hypothetical protein